MTDPAAPDPQPPDRSWCWISSPESRAANRLSVLAVVETVLAVIAYWWIAVEFDTYLHLAVSVLAAPLVLLRSDESVKMGARLFQEFAEEEQIGRVWNVATVIVAAGCAGMGAWVLATHWLVDFDDWPLFWRSAILGVMALNTGLAVAGAVAVTVTGISTGALFLGPGIMFGYLLRAMLIRVLATVAHLPKGVKEFPRNWIFLNACSDVKTPPELVPGLPMDSVFRLERLISGFNDRSFDDRIFYSIAIPVFFVPSLLYRYSLKSTAWLYLPIIYIASLPARLSSVVDREVWLGFFGNYVLGWLQLGLAVVSLGIAFFSFLDVAAFARVLDAAREIGVPLTPLGIVFVLDWSAVQPWHFVSLPSAALTVALYLWTNQLRARIRAERRVEKDTGATLSAPFDFLGAAFNALLWVVRLRNILTITWVAIALYGFLALALETCKIPADVQFLLEWHFGPVACDRG